MRDPYKALGVQPNASDAEIKKAYRRLAQEFHPDRNPGDAAKEKRFKDISAAYNIVGDPEKRKQFDNAASGGSIPMGDLSEIFAQMFGGRAGRGRGGGNPFAGSPFAGVGGMGGASPFGAFGGSAGFGGSPFDGAPRQQRRAPQKPSAPVERKIKTRDGAELTQRGDHIYSDLRVPFHEAMLGTTATVSTLSGKAKVKIPAGASSGQKLRLKGKGAKGSKAHGDHYVTLHIDVPKVETDEARTLLSQLVESLSKANK